MKDTVPSGHSRSEDWFMFWMLNKKKKMNQESEAHCKDENESSYDSNEFILCKWNEHISCTVKPRGNGCPFNNEQAIQANDTKSNRMHGNMNNDHIPTATTSISIMGCENEDHCKNNQSTEQQHGARTARRISPVVVDSQEIPVSIVMTGNSVVTGCNQEDPRSSSTELSMLHAYNVLMDSSRKYWNIVDIIHRAQLQESPVVILSQVPSASQNIPISRPSISSMGRNILGRIATARPRQCRI
jgi:hypothetical protein